jgi:N-acyl-D-amino-acid deacylase
MTEYDLLIRNAEIVDGTGAPSFRGDIAIHEGRVAAVGSMPSSTAMRILDVGGKIVAPGHITQHAHYDAAIFWSPQCLDSGPQGVTSILNANCGFSMAPVRPADRERTMVMLANTEQIPVEQQRAALPWDWVTFPEFMARLRALPKSVNIMTYLPLNPLLIYVMGIDAAKSRQPNGAEIAEMHRLINEAMDAGAMGISASVMGAEGNTHVDFDGTSMPTDTLTRESILAISQGLIDRGGGIVQFFANVGPNGDRETSEDVARAAKGSGVRVIHNILVTVEGHPDLVEADIQWIDGMRNEGLDITGATLLHYGWVEGGIRDLETSAGAMAGVRAIISCATDEEILALLSNADFVKGFSEEYLRDGPSNSAAGFEAFTVVDMGGDPKLDLYLGRTLGDIASGEGRPVVAVLCDLGVRSGLGMQLKSTSFSAWDASLPARMLSHPSIAAGVSDGGAHTKSMSNGFYGTELLVRMGREQKAMSLEELHFQLSFKIARTLGILDRGAILPGYWADLIVYDLGELYVDYSKFDIVHDMPTGDWRRETRAGGYAHIFVNGIETFTGGSWTKATPGALITSSHEHAPIPVAA